jgi:hypothetical protein
MDHYNCFMERCDASRPEYEILKNGVITRDRQEKRAVEILCELEDARMILDLAIQIYPHAAPHLEACISLARQPRSVAPRAAQRERGTMHSELIKA